MERKYLRKISFPGFGTKSPYFTPYFSSQKAPGAVVLSLKSTVHTGLY